MNRSPSAIINRLVRNPLAPWDHVVGRLRTIENKLDTLAAAQRIASLNAASPAPATETFLPREQEILKYITKDMKGLEIGPYFNPIAPKAAGYKSLSLDVFPADELRRHAAADVNIPQHMVSNIEEVDLIGSATDLERLVIDKYGAQSLDYIVSSHNFEHLPNPILFLQSCMKALRPGGYLSMAIPDMRCCFDYFRWPSTITHWLQSYFEQRSQPTPAQVFELNASHCRPVSFDLAFPRDQITPLQTLREAYDSWVNFNAHPTSGYQDSHCSTLTANSFALLLLELRFLGLVSMEIVEIKGPAGNEFYAHLRNAPTTSLSAAEFYPKREQLMRAVIAEIALKV